MYDYNLRNGIEEIKRQIPFGVTEDDPLAVKVLAVTVDTYLNVSGVESAGKLEAAVYLKIITTYSA